MYLKCEVLLLAVFEKFRNNSLKNYELCPRHYFSAPGLSWDTMLKITKIEPEFITDSDTWIFFEEVKFLLFLIDTKKPTIKYLKSYDPKQESKHIMYLDANNSYGYKMSKFLSTNRFKWIDSKEFDLNKYTGNS